MRQKTNTSGINSSVRLSPTEQAKQRLEVEAAAKKAAMSPAARNRMFPMGGFTDTKLDFNSDGLLSDDGESYDLDELSL